MRIPGLLRLTVLSCVILLAACSTSQLERAGALGDAGGKLATQAAVSYSFAGAQLAHIGVAHCASRVLAVGRPNCDASPSEAIANLEQLIEARVAYFQSLNATYAAMAETSRLPPISLTDATNATLTLAGQVSTILKTEFPATRQDEVRSASARLEALLQIAEEARRVHDLREASSHIRATLPVIIASYEVERDVLTSIDRANAANGSDLITGLTARDLLNSDAIIGGASQTLGVPVRDKSAEGWRTAQGRALITFLANEEERAAIRQRAQANALIVAGLQSLNRMHMQFENNQSLTVEDVQTLSDRLARLLGAPAPAPAAQEPANAH